MELGKSDVTPPIRRTPRPPARCQLSCQHPANTPRSCITARRRRKAGRQPYYGTGWAARPGQNTQPYYNNNNYQQPPPQYTPQPQQGQNSYYGNGANQGYYGQQNGVELQQPPATYARAGEETYAPPPGPPPGKGDGIIR